MSELDFIGISKRVWCWRRWVPALVITALVSSALAILVGRVIGGNTIVKGIVSGLAIFSWVGIVIIYLMASPSETKGLYLKAISLVGMGLRSDKEYLQIIVELSNGLDKIIDYRFDLDNCYTTIEGNRQGQSDGDMKGTTINGKSTSLFNMPRFVLPKSFPCKCIVHYEMLYGPVEKPLFRRVSEVYVDIGYKIEGSNLEIMNWVIQKEDDKAIEKVGQSGKVMR